MSTFKKATKTQSRLRMALYGVSGSGKTYSALAIATGLGGKIAVIDTERGSASKYASRFNFDVLDMQPPYSPAAYVTAIKAAEAEGYDILIIDSLTHAWAGTGGALEMVDNAAKRSQSSNSYVAWRDVTPEHNKLIDAIIQSRCHVIATMRSKVEYVMEANEKGKMVPRKKAMAPVQRDGMEYEFDVVAEMTADTDMVVQKSRCEALTGQVVSKPNGQVSATLRAWLNEGVPMPVSDAIPPTTGATNGKPPASSADPLPWEVAPLTNPTFAAILANAIKCAPKPDAPAKDNAGLYDAMKATNEKAATRGIDTKWKPAQPPTGMDVLTHIYALLAACETFDANIPA